MRKPRPWELDILLGEDTPSDIELFQMALERCGQVRSLNIVRDGEELVSYLRGDPPFEAEKRPSPNVIIMDLKMPRMDGFDVLSWLGNHPDCSVIPAIVLSSSREEADVAKAYKLGANAFFSKPANFAELEEILRLIFEFWDRAVRPPLKKPICAA